MISIISTINYGLGGGTNTTMCVMGSNEDRNYGLVKKCYCSEKAIELYIYCFMNNYNLEEFTMLKVTKTGQYSFLNVKLKAVILPLTVTSVGNRIATFCDRLEYLIFPTNLTSISGPITNNTKIKKLIYPENWKQNQYAPQNMKNVYESCSIFSYFSSKILLKKYKKMQINFIYIFYCSRRNKYFINFP